MPKKIIKYLCNIITIILLFVLIFVSIKSYQNYQNGKIKNEVPTSSAPQKETIQDKNEKYQEIYALFSPDIDLKTYQKQYNNQDIIARLEIPNLFNIFITKTTNNEYYLNHSIDKKKDKKGTEYMDYRTEPTAKQINIYGHNSRTYDLAFRKLEKYLEKDFFENNPYILLQHESGHRLYEITSIKEVKKDYEHMKVDIATDQYTEHIKKLLENSIYQRNIEYDNESNILVLQTCSYTDDNVYYIITAIELK